MRATGIVRRIDDLGRVVIPKEIRRQMKIREGDPLEIYTTNDGCVCFKKYEADIDWDIIRKVVRTVLTCGFTILNRYEEVKVAVGGVHITDYKMFEVRYEGDVVAYLKINRASVEDYSKQILEAVKIIGAFFED